jgi:hypothetical protein
MTKSYIGGILVGVAVTVLVASEFHNAPAYGSDSGGEDVVVKVIEGWRDKEYGLVSKAMAGLGGGVVATQWYSDIQTLKSHKNVAVKILIKTVSNRQNDVNLRIYAMAALEEFGEEAAEIVPILVNIIKTEKNLRYCAVACISQMGKKAAPAIEMLEDLQKAAKGDDEIFLKILISFAIRNIKEAK